MKSIIELFKQNELKDAYTQELLVTFKKAADAEEAMKPKEETKEEESKDKKKGKKKEGATSLQFGKGTR